VDLLCDDDTFAGQVRAQAALSVAFRAMTVGLDGRNFVPDPAHPAGAEVLAACGDLLGGRQ
jgi:hypothetical protein